MPTCSECGSSNIRIAPYDYGVCQETGYHDAGEMYACADCGARGDADQLNCDATLDGGRVGA